MLDLLTYQFNGFGHFRLSFSDTWRGVNVTQNRGTSIVDDVFILQILTLDQFLNKLEKIDMLYKISTEETSSMSNSNFLELGVEIDYYLNADHFDACRP